MRGLIVLLAPPPHGHLYRLVPRRKARAVTPSDSLELEILSDSVSKSLGKIRRDSRKFARTTGAGQHPGGAARRAGCRRPALIGGPTLTVTAGRSILRRSESAEDCPANASFYWRGGRFRTTI